MYCVNHRVLLREVRRVLRRERIYESVRKLTAVVDTSIQSWAEGIIHNHQETAAPVTYWFIVLITLVFLFELGMTTMYSLRGTNVFATGLFGAEPLLAWPLAPVLHRRPLHFFASIFGLIILGVPVERHWSRVKYALFLIVAGYVSVGIGGGILILFSDEQIAFYGTSGVVYALGEIGRAHV